MELKSYIPTFFLLSLLLTASYFARGGSLELDSDVYEIDYRGPETHSSIPPPDHFRGKPMNRQESAPEPAKCKGLRGCNTGGNGKKIHG